MSNLKSTTYLRLNGNTLHEIEINSYEIKKQLTDVKNLNEAKSSYSIPIDIPITPQSSAIFGSLFNLNNTSTIYKQRVPAQLIDDNHIIVNGNIYIDQITTDNYKIIIASSDLTIFEDIENLYLDDLNFTGGEYSFSGQSLASQLSDNENYNTATNNDLVKFVHIDWNNDGLSIVPPQFNGVGEYLNKLNQVKLSPVIKVKPVFDKIFSEQGYSYSASTKFEDKLEKMDITTNVPDSNYTMQAETKYFFVDTGGGVTNLNSKNHLTQQYIIGETKINSYVNPRQDNDTTIIRPYFQKGSNYNITLNIIAEKISGNDVDLEFELVRRDGFGNEDGKTVKIGDVTVTGSTNVPTMYTISTTHTPENDEILGDNYSVKVKDDDNPDYKLYSEYSAVTDPSSIIINDNKYIYHSANTFTFNDLLPQGYTQHDFLNDVLSIYNMYMQADEANPSLFYIRDYDDYYSPSQVLDWSNKIDLDGIEISEFSSNLDKEYRLSYNDGEDAISSEFQEKYDRPQNTQIIRNDNKNAENNTQEIKITRQQGVFTDRYKLIDRTNASNTFKAPVMSHYSQRNNAVIFGFATRFDVPVGLTNTYYIPLNWLDDQTEAPQPYHVTSYYLTLSPYYYGESGNLTYSNLSNASTFALYFNPQEQYFDNSSLSTVTANDLYKNFWGKEVETKLKSVQKYVKARFKLRPNDLQIENFRKKVKINNNKIGDALYHLQSITYSSDPDTLAEVELIKLDNYKPEFDNTKAVINYQFIGTTEGTTSGGGSSTGGGGSTDLSGYLQTNVFNPYSADTATEIDNKLDSDEFTDWTGVTAPNTYYCQDYIDNNYYTRTASDNRYVEIAGDTMTGALHNDQCISSPLLSGTTTCGNTVCGNTLDISGNADIAGNITTNSRIQINSASLPATRGGLELGYDTTNERGVIQAFQTGTTNYSCVLIGNPNSGNVTINQSGGTVSLNDCVGIGTTSPQASLDVRGGSAEKIRLGYNETIISPYISFYEGVTRRGYFQFDVGNNKIVINNEQTGTVLNFLNGCLSTNTMVEADTYYRSTDNAVVLGTDSIGTVFLRPTAYNSGTCQSTFTTSLATIGTDACIQGDLDVQCQTTTDSLRTDSIRSTNYQPGDLLGSGFLLENQSGNAVMNADEGIFRKKFRATTLEISKITATNGDHWFSTAGVGDSDWLTDSNGTYFEIDGVQPFAKGDYIISQIVDPGSTGYQIYRHELYVYDTATGSTGQSKIYVYDVSTGATYSTVADSGTSNQINPVTEDYSGFNLLQSGDYVELFSDVDLKAGTYRFGFNDYSYTADASANLIIMRVYNSSMTLQASSASTVQNSYFYADVEIPSDLTGAVVRAERGGSSEKNILFDPELNQIWPDYDVHAERLSISPQDMESPQDQTFVRLGNKFNKNRQRSLFVNVVGSELSPSLAIYNEINSPNVDQSDLKAVFGNIENVTLQDGTNASGYGVYSDNAYLEGKIFADTGQIGGFNISQTSLQGETLGEGYVKINSDNAKLALIDNTVEKVKIFNKSLSPVGDLAVKYRNLDYEASSWPAGKSLALNNTTDLDNETVDGQVRDWKRISGTFQIKDVNNNNQNSGVTINYSPHADDEFYVGVGNDIDYEIDVALYVVPGTGDPIVNDDTYTDLDQINVLAQIRDENNNSIKGVGKFDQKLTRSGGVIDVKLSGSITNSSFDNFYFRLFTSARYDTNSWNSIISFEGVVKKVQLITNAQSITADVSGNTEIAGAGIQTVYDEDNYFRVEKQTGYNVDIKGGLNVDTITASGQIEADTYFKSSDATAIIGTNSTGTVALRPDAFNSTSFQSSFSTSLATLGTNTCIQGDLNVNATTNLSGLTTISNTSSGEQLRIGYNAATDPYISFYDQTQGESFIQHLTSDDKLRLINGAGFIDICTDRVVSQSIFEVNDTACMNCTLNVAGLSNLNSTVCVSGRYLQTNSLAQENISLMCNSNSSTSAGSSCRRVLDLDGNVDENGNINLIGAKDGGLLWGYMRINSSDQVVLAQASDKCLKKNIHPTKVCATSMINNIPVMDFSWKHKKNDNCNIGLIAQDVEDIVPNLVTNEGDWKSVSYDVLHPYYIKAIQELTCQNIDLKKCLENIEKLIK